MLKTPKKTKGGRKPELRHSFRDGDSITIEGKRYIIAGLVSGGFTLIDCGSVGFMEKGGLL